MAFDFSNTLNGIVYLTPTQFTTLSNKNGTVSGATQLFSDKIYILNDSLTTTSNNVLLTASAITNNFAHSAHTHAISDINNLQASLDSKLSTSSSGTAASLSVGQANNATYLGNTYSAGNFREEAFWTDMSTATSTTSNPVTAGAVYTYFHSVCAEKTDAGINADPSVSVAAESNRTKFTFALPRVNGIYSFAQTAASSDPGGTNTWVLTLCNSSAYTITLKNGYNGTNGKNGYTVLPSVDGSGNISWTLSENTTGTAPATPATANIRGPIGLTGSAVNAVALSGTFNGDSLAYNLYNVTRAGDGANIGTFSVRNGATGATGGAGPQGPIGYTYLPSISSNFLWFSSITQTSAAGTVNTGMGFVEETILPSVVSDSSAPVQSSAIYAAIDAAKGSTFNLSVVNATQLQLYDNKAKGYTGSPITVPFSTCAAFPYGFVTRSTDATWGAGNTIGTFMTGWTGPDGSDIAFRNNSGQLNIVLDGYYYQNEGQYRVLDTSDLTGNWTGTWQGNSPSSFAAASHTHTKSQITDFPTSMPASDVYDWAKATTKPKYTYSEVDAASSEHTHAYLPLSGGTMTGAISWFGDTDGSYIGYDYTGGDLGRFFINMIDDSNTEIHFRWNGNAAYVFQQTLMNAAGVTISAGNFSGAWQGNSPSSFAAAGHTHTKSQITDFPSSMPASDVYAWAKAATKPTYTYSEVSAASSAHTHAISDVNNLQNSLDSKLSTSSSGTAANLSVGNSDKLGNRDSTGFMRAFSYADNIYSQSFSAFASNYSFGAAMLKASDGPIGEHWTHLINLGWNGGEDWITQLAFATEYGTGAYYRVAGDNNGSNIGNVAWKRLIDSDNIGSQSVNNSTYLGNTYSAGNFQAEAIASTVCSTCASSPVNGIAIAAMFTYCSTTSTLTINF